MFGRARTTIVSALASSPHGSWQVDVLDANALQRKVKAVGEVHERLRREICGKRNGVRQRQTMRCGHLVKFAVGDYVLVSDT